MKKNIRQNINRYGIMIKCIKCYNLSQNKSVEILKILLYYSDDKEIVINGKRLKTNIDC